LQVIYGQFLFSNVAGEKADFGFGALYLWYYEYQFLDFTHPYIRTGKKNLRNLKNLSFISLTKRNHVSDTPTCTTVRFGGAGAALFQSCVVGSGRHCGNRRFAVVAAVPPAQKAK